MPQIKRDVRIGLRNEDDLPAKSVRDSDLVEHIRVPASAVANHHLGAVNQRHDILDDSGVLPDVIGSSAPQSNRLRRPLQRRIYCIESQIEGHHHRYQFRLDIFIVGQLKDSGPLAPRLSVSQKNSVKVDLFDSPMSAEELEVISYIEFCHESI